MATSLFNQQQSLNAIQRIKSDFTSGASIKVYINVEKDASIGGTGHVQVGVQSGTGSVVWFGYSPLSSDLPFSSYATGTPGQMKLEKIDDKNYQTLSLSSNETSAVLQSVEQKISEGVTTYALFRGKGQDCLSTLESVFSETSVPVDRIVGSSNLPGAVVPMAWSKYLKSIDYASPINRCFLAGTPILLLDGTTRPIESIESGDAVATFNGDVLNSPITTGKVRRIFGNITQEVIAISYHAAGQNRVMYQTPLHVMQTPKGFMQARDALMAQVPFVEINGSLVHVSSYEMIRYGTARGDELSSTLAAFKPVTGMIYMDEHGLALAPQDITGWQTYNFEVADTHTYIAGGLRVHNTSIQDVIAHDLGGNYNPQNVIITEVSRDASGALVGRSGYVEDNNHQLWNFTGAADAGGNTYTYRKTVESLIGDNPIVRTVEDRTVQAGILAPVSVSGTDGSGNTFTEGFDSLGALTSYVFTKAGGGQMSLTGSDIGAVLGSSIGNALGGNSFAAKITVTTLVSSVAQTVAGIISRPTFDANGQRDGSTSLLARFNDGTTSLDQAFSETLTQFGKAVPINLLNNVTGGVSSLLVGELANAIGLKGFAAGAFTTVGTTITTQLVNNLVSMTLGTANLPANFNTIFNTSGQGIFSGFDAVSFGANMAGAVGGFLGSYLASTIFTPKSAAGSLGASIGSSIGSFIGTWLGGPIGAAIGSFLGSALGGVIGDLFAAPDKAWASMSVRSDGYITTAAGQKNGGNMGLYVTAVNGAQAEVNAILDIMHGHIVSLGSRGAVDYYFYGHNRDDARTNLIALNSSKGGKTFYDTGSGIYDPSRVIDTGATQQVWHDGGEYSEGYYTTDKIYDDSKARLTYQDGARVMVEEAAMMTLKNATIIDADTVMSTAFNFAVANDATVSSIYSDLGIAKSYENYLQNTAAINRLIDDSPNSVFAASWIATLKRAGEMGLNALEFATLKNDDGTRAEIRYDKYNTTAWGYVQKQFSAAGALQSETITLDTGKVVQFDAMEYMASNVDVALAFKGAVGAAEAHYLANGINEHRSVNSFDAMEYMASNTGLALYFKGDISAARQHYVGFGINEGRATASFDAAYYMAANGDVASWAHGDAALARYHYVVNGINEHRSYRTNTVENGNSVGRTYAAGSGALNSQTITPVAGAANWFVNYTQWYNEAGQQTRWAGLRTNGNGWDYAYNPANGKYTSTTEIDTNNDEVWATETSLYNAGGSLYQTNVVNDDGTKRYVYYDVDNVNWWSAITAYNNQTGQLTLQTGTNHDGQTWTWGYNNGVISAAQYYDAANAYGWKSFHNDYTATGQLTQQLFVNDDGSKTNTYYDVNNVNYWTQTTVYYNPAGQITLQTGICYDGQTWSQKFVGGVTSAFDAQDAANKYNWKTYHDDYNASGQQIDRVMVYDDGAQANTYYDVNNTNWWVNYTAYYNAVGSQTLQTGTNHDGQTWTWKYSNGVVAYTDVQDAANTYIWKSFHNDYTAKGQLTQQLFINDDGSKTNTYYDVNNVNYWTQTTVYYNPAGQITLQTGICHDGQTWSQKFVGGVTSAFDAQDAANKYNWKTYHDDYNASGQQINRVMMYDDGTQANTYYDVNNTYWWVNYTANYTSGGKETSASGLNHDGQTWSQHYTNGIIDSSDTQDAGNKYSWKSYHNDYTATGQLTQQLFVNDGGSRINHYYDVANANWWATLDTFFDASSKLTSQTATDHEGKTFIWNFSGGKVISTDVADATNKYSWKSYHTDFNAADQQIDVLYTNDDGTKVNYYYDPANVNWYQTYTAYFDASGKQTGQTAVGDDGQTINWIYNNGVLTSNDSQDAANKYSWKSYHTDFNAAGKQLNVLYVNDDGTKTNTYYDLANINSWSEKTVSFNVANQITRQTTINYDGQTTVQTYSNGVVAYKDAQDAANKYTWKSYHDDYTTSGQLMNHLVIGDDGSKYNTYYDVTNANPWSQKSVSINVANQMIRQTGINDDGQTWSQSYTNGIMIYEDAQDAGNKYSWSSYRKSYSATGQPIDQSIINDNGSKVSYGYQNNQTLTSTGASIDTLIAQGTAALFVIHKGYLTEDIQGFHAGSSKAQLDTSLFTNYASFYSAAMDNTSGGVTATSSNGSSVIFEGLHKNQLQASDFRFV